MSRGYRNSDYMAIRPGGRGDVTGTHIEWRTPSGGSYVLSIVYYHGLLYMTNEVGVVTCADANTGKHLWRQRLGGVFFASPVAGDGKSIWSAKRVRRSCCAPGRKPEVLAQNDLGERFHRLAGHREPAAVLQKRPDPVRRGTVNDERSGPLSAAGIRFLE